MSWFLQLRLVDLFLDLDKDRSGEITKEEFVIGLQVRYLTPTPCPSPHSSPLNSSSFPCLTLLHATISKPEYLLGPLPLLQSCRPAMKRIMPVISEALSCCRRHHRSDRD